MLVAIAGHTEYHWMMDMVYSHDCDTGDTEVRETGISELEALTKYQSYEEYNPCGL